MVSMSEHTLRQPLHKRGNHLDLNLEKCKIYSCKSMLNDLFVLISICIKLVKIKNLLSLYFSGPSPQAFLGALVFEKHGYFSNFGTSKLIFLAKKLSGRR